MVEPDSLLMERYREWFRQRWGGSPTRLDADAQVGQGPYSSRVDACDLTGMLDDCGFEGPNGLLADLVVTAHSRAILFISS